MKKALGPIVIATGVLHTVIAFVAYREAWGTMLGSGFVNSAVNHSDTGEAQWFLLIGGLLIAMGVLLQFTVARTKTIPLAFGVIMLIACAVSVILFPASGAWIVVVTSIIMIVISLRDRRRISVSLGGTAQSASASPVGR